MPEEYSAQYIGGHSAYPNATYVKLIPLEDSLSIVGLGSSQTFELPYASIATIETKTQEQLSAARIFLVGILAWAWKRKKQFMVIGFTDNAGLSHDMVFDLANIELVQPTIYNRVVAYRSRTAQGAKKEAAGGPESTQQAVARSSPTSFCPQCGTSVGTGDRFCRVCGRDLTLGEVEKSRLSTQLAPAEVMVPQPMHSEPPLEVGPQARLATPEPEATEEREEDVSPANYDLFDWRRNIKRALAILLVALIIPSVNIIEGYGFTWVWGGVSVINCCAFTSAFDYGLGGKVQAAVLLFSVVAVSIALFNPRRKALSLLPLVLVSVQFIPSLYVIYHEFAVGVAYVPLEEITMLSSVYFVLNAYRFRPWVQIGAGLPSAIRKVNDRRFWYAIAILIVLTTSMVAATLASSLANRPDLRIQSVSTGSGGAGMIVSVWNHGSDAVNLDSIVIGNGTVYARFANPCTNGEACLTSQGYQEFQLALFIYPNQSKLIVNSSSYYALPIGPNAGLSILLPYSSLPNTQYTVLLETANGRNDQISVTSPSTVIQTTSSGQQLLGSTSFSITNVYFPQAGTMRFGVWNLKPAYSNLMYLVVYNGTAFYHFARLCPNGVPANCVNGPNEGAWTYELDFYVLPDGTKTTVSNEVFVPTTFNPSAGPGYLTISFDWKPGTTYVVMVADTAISTVVNPSVTAIGP